MHPPLMHTQHGGSTEGSAQPHYSPTQPPRYTGSSHCFDDPSIVQWLQSAGLQHLAVPLSAAAADHRLLPHTCAQQEHAGNASQPPEDRPKFRKAGNTVTGASNPADAMPHPVFPMPSKQSSLQPSVKVFLSSELRSNDLSPGIFDIHAIDSELLPEEAASGWLDSCSPFVPVDEQGFENENDVEYANSYSPTRMQIYPPESFSRPATADKARARENENGPAKIKVVVRKRPINKKELSRNEEDIICVARNGGSLTVHEPKVKVDLTAYVEKHEFVFDAVLDEDVTNDEVYHVTVEPIIPTIFERTKATCFAYGQTGSGKTYTMQPLPIKASESIFHMMQQPQYRYQGYQLWLSFFEIYGGKLFDLLNDRSKLCMREDGRQQVCIVGLKEFRVLELNMLRDYIERGSAARSTGMTGANEESSRSHAILQLSLKRISDVNESKPARMVGKISFIDLAGSERGADTTDNDRQTRLEGAEINKSLLALKECIRALDSDQGHIPFRGSKLTEVLRDSFVGDSRTVMISCISPSAGSCEHTLNTLRYADRVKGLSRNNNSKKDLLGPLPSQREFCPAPTMPSHLQRPPSSNEGNHVPEEISQSGRENLGSSQRELCLRSVRLPYLSDDALQTGQQTFGADHLFSTSYYDSEFCKDENHRECMGGDEDAFKGTAGVQGAFLDNRQHDKHNISQQPSCLRLTKEGNFGAQWLPAPKEGNLGAQWLPAPIDSAQELNPRFFSIPNLISTHAGQPQPRANDRMCALLKEEDDLVTAHCKELEDTIDIVREEMKLLSEVDQPGGQISLYVTQLSKVLSKKAAGLVSLQAQLARFQQLLKEQEIVALNAGLQPA